MVLANYSQDETWYRARVRHVVSKKSDKDDADKDVLVGADVVYFDFGNSEMVPIDRFVFLFTGKKLVWVECPGACFIVKKVPNLLVYFPRKHAVKRHVSMVNGLDKMM